MSLKRVFPAFDVFKAVPYSSGFYLHYTFAIRESFLFFKFLTIVSPILIGNLRVVCVTHVLCAQLRD